MLRALPSAALVAATLLHSSVPQPPPGADRSSRIQAFHQDRAGQAGIVGSSLMLVREGTVAGKWFQGYQDLETRRPVDEDTIYHWASITKMFTGVAIMQLRDRGELSLDEADNDAVVLWSHLVERFGITRTQPADQVELAVAVHATSTNAHGRET